MKIILILASLALLGVGCSYDQQTQRQTKTVEQNDVTGTVAGAPVELHHRRTVTAQEQEQVQGQKSMDMEWMAPVAQGALGFLSGGTGVGLIGILAGAWAWIKKGRSDRALAETVGGIEKAKSEMTGDQHDRLLSVLREYQSADTQSAVDKLTP